MAWTGVGVSKGYGGKSYIWDTFSVSLALSILFKVSTSVLQHACWHLWKMQTLP